MSKVYDIVGLEIEVGDTLMCVDDTGYPHDLFKGTSYKVKSLDDKLITVVNVDGCGEHITCYGERFKKVYLRQKDGSLTKTQKAIITVCDLIKGQLLDKNRKYGDSAIHPKRVFSKSSAIEQINVRIDDKISRIMSAQDDDIEDAEFDLLGYLMLKMVAKEVHKNG